MPTALGLLITFVVFDYIEAREGSIGSPREHEVGSPHTPQCGIGVRGGSTNVGKARLQLGTGLKVSSSLQGRSQLDALIVIIEETPITVVLYVIGGIKSFAVDNSTERDADH